MRSNGIDVKVSSLSALDVFMEPGRSARIRCGVCHKMQQVKRGLMAEHDDCAGSYTHYTFDHTYEVWQSNLATCMDALHKAYSGPNAIDPRVRRATPVSPVRYPAKPTSVVRLAQLRQTETPAPRLSQTSGHLPDALARLDADAKQPRRRAA